MSPQLALEPLQSPPSASAAPAAAPPEPAKPAKRSQAARSRAGDSTATKATAKKRARLTVAPDETTQVTRLDDRYQLHLADADAYYVPDLVKPETAQAWHDELLNLEECKLPASTTVQYSTLSFRSRSTRMLSPLCYRAPARLFYPLAYVVTGYRPTLKVYGRQVTQSRQIAAFATDPDLQVKYSGTEVRMSYVYPPLLREIQDLIEAKLGVKFNHCMLNLYENGREFGAEIYIGNHRDNRENRVIASLSLGAPRTFILTHDKPPPAPSEPKAEPSAPPNLTSDLTLSDLADPPPLRYSHRFVLENGSLVVMQGTMQQFWKHQVPKEKKVDKSRISLTFRQLVF
ncbi:hypothetical protein BMF94_4175 [Rhodotorula taiwanensis]|uniref:Fe2OG dioxygenase domain-containing protein n=1 Tax=Rhodotorula taiwanensis TaxID=741276 RepID=A0A2S5B7N0_9BASI|nr:hypothetical protein BMF94_4175 [Rhodotorula taiwanensis]